MESRLLGGRSVRLSLTIGGALHRLEASRGALGPLAALLAALGPVPAAAGSVAIDTLQVDPNPFSPNGDGTHDATTVSFFPRGAGDSVVARVTVSENATSVLVATLLDDTTVPVDALVEALWDPGSIADGHYRFDIRLAEGPDTAGATVVVTADTTPPLVTLGSVEPAPFDPVGVHESDSLSVPFTVTTDTLTSTTTTVSMRQNGAIVATLGTFVGAGSDTLRWGGHRAGSATPLSGRYEARARALDLAGNADSASVFLYMDVEDPEFRFPGGHSDTTMTTSFPVTLSGSVRDGTRVDSVRVSFDGTTFVPVDSMSAVSDSVFWSVVVTDPDPTPGRRDVTLRAFDVFGDAPGHFSDHVQTVAYDVAFPAKVDSTVVLNENATVLRGERLEIRTFWNRDDLQMSADMSTLDSGFLESDASFGFVNEGGGSYLYRYDVTFTNNRRSGDKQVTIRAATPYLVATDTIRVTLGDGRAASDQLLYIDKNWFDPLAGETVTISSEFASESIRVEVWNLAGHLVRKLEGNGLVTWDGTSDAGREVASGVYFLRLRTDDGEEKRKVGVVRGGRR